MILKNAISVDLEDWFCVQSLSSVVKKEDWDRCELRVFEGTKRILNLLHKHNTHATFFVLGWIAERLPELIREIEKAGHEIATHGYNHLLLTQTTPAGFEEDLAKGLWALKKCGVKQEILGFRAPSFTMVKETMWALKILEKYNIKYDSSVFPISFRPKGEISNIPLSPYKITERLYEFPLSCVKFWGINMPCSGGVCFRIFPYAYTRYCINRCNSLAQPVVFYLHPWELDPEQPRLRLPWTSYFRHYYNLGRSEKRLAALLSDFQFTTIREVLGL